MPDILSARLGPHRRRGLLLDSNLLLLYVVGISDRRLIRSFKRTQAFTDADFRLLVGLMSAFDVLVTTPHVLTEVNGLMNALKGAHKPRVRARMSLAALEWDERHVPARDLVGAAAFLGFGLTDAALAALSQSEDGPLVMSTDGALVQFISRSGGVADHFEVYQHLHAQR